MAGNIKTRLESGNLVFYEGEDTNRATTGHPILTISPTEIKIGSSTNDVDLKVLLGSEAEYVLFDSGNSRLALAAPIVPATSNGAALGTTSLMWSDLFLASGAVINFNAGNITMTHSAGKITVASTWATPGRTGRPFGVELTLTGTQGSYVNALKGYVDASAGGTTGLLSAVNCEIKMPTGACEGAFYPLEIEWVGQAGTSFGTPGTGSQSGFIFIAATGTVGDLDSDGVFMSINGLSAGSGAMLSTSSQTLKVDLDQGGTARYLVMSIAEDILSHNFSAIDDNGKIMKLQGTWPTPDNPDGMGLLEVDITISGTSGTSASLSSMWANLGSSSTITQYLTLRNDGIYDAGATLTNAEISMHKYHCQLASNPDLLTIWDLNFVDVTNDVIDAIYEVNNPATSMGYIVGGATDGGGIGTIPFLITAGTIMYIHVYNDRT